MNKRNKKQIKENIYNIPNFLTLIRVVLTFVLFYLFLMHSKVMLILITFAIAAITDFLDGQVARRFMMVTNFGAKFDITADRFLWITTGICILFFFPLWGVFNGFHLLQMFLIMGREIMCFPFVVVTFFRKKKVMPEARWSGKTTTFLQGFAIPILIFSALGYTFFNLSIVLSVITFISGIWAAYDYSHAVGFFKKK